MKPATSLFVVLILTASASAGPVLLATGGGTGSVQLPGLMDTVTLNGFLRLQRTVDGGIETFDLFDGQDTIVSLDAPPITVSGSIESIVDDPDFGAFQTLLTNDDNNELVFLLDLVVGLIGDGGSEDWFLELLVPPLSEADLFGYEIQRIDRTATYQMTTTTDGLGTYVWIDETVLFYGVPEPSTLVLAAFGCLALLRKRGVKTVNG